MTNQPTPSNVFLKSAAPLRHMPGFERCNNSSRCAKIVGWLKIVRYGWGSKSNHYLYLLFYLHSPRSYTTRECTQRVLVPFLRICPYLFIAKAHGFSKTLKNVWQKIETLSFAKRFCHRPRSRTATSPNLSPRKVRNSCTSSYLIPSSYYIHLLCRCGFTFDRSINQRSLICVVSEGMKIKIA